MSRNTFVFAMLLGVRPCGRSCRRAGAARAVCLRLRVSPGDNDISPRHRARHSRARGQRDERWAGSLVLGTGSGCEVSVRGQRNRPRARAIVCGESGDRRADANKRRALDGKHHGASLNGQSGPVSLVANYGDQKQGTIASIPIGADGRLGRRSTRGSSAWERWPIKSGRIPAIALCTCRSRAGPPSRNSCSIRPPGG